MTQTPFTKKNSGNQKGQSALAMTFDPKLLEYTF